MNHWPSGNYSTLQRRLIGFVGISISILHVSSAHHVSGEPIESVLGSSLTTLSEALVGMMIAFLAFSLYFYYMGPCLDA
jgi:small neutral amino acid transporter SnatA (MarC family)